MSTGNHMVGVDLFSGAGGMALGANHAGINVKLAIEADTYAAALRIVTAYRAIEDIDVEREL